MATRQQLGGRGVLVDFIVEAGCRRCWQQQAGQLRLFCVARADQSTLSTRFSLTPLGIAKLATSKHQTRIGVVKSKLAYMAPEQFGGDVDCRADIFSVGVMLWEIAARQRSGAICRSRPWWGVWFLEICLTCGSTRKWMRG